MSIACACQQCGCKFKAREELAGKLVKCPKCKEKLRLPGVAAAAPQPPPPPAKSAIPPPVTPVIPPPPSVPGDAVTPSIIIDADSTSSVSNRLRKRPAGRISKRPAWLPFVYVGAPMLLIVGLLGWLLLRPAGDRQVAQQERSTAPEAAPSITHSSSSQPMFESPPSSAPTDGIPTSDNTKITLGPGGDGVIIDESAQQVDAGRRSARQWLAELDSNDPRKRGAAIVALRKLGAEGITALGQAMKSDSAAVRGVAADALGELAQEHDQALAILAEAVQDEDPRKISPAVMGLAAAGERGVPALVGLMDNSNKLTRLQAYSALAKMGSKAAAATTPLIAHLKSADEIVRLQAAGLLGKIGPAAAPATPDLIQAAKGDDKQLAAAAITALGAIGAAPEETIPLLMTFWRSDPQLTSALSKSASNALAKMGTPAIKPLVDELADSASPHRSAVLRTLQEMGPPALPTLLRIVREERDPAIHYNAISAIATMKSAAAEAVPDLVRLLEEGDNENSKTGAVYALTQIGSASRPAVPVLLDRISKRPQSASAELSALLKIGGVDQSALDVLAKSLAQGELPSTRESAADAIGKFCGSSEATVQVLATALQTDDSSLVRQHAAKTLASLAASSPSARTVLEEARKSDDRETRAAAQSAR